MTGIVMNSIMRSCLISGSGKQTVFSEMKGKPRAQGYGSSGRKYGKDMDLRRIRHLISLIRGRW